MPYKDKQAQRDYQKAWEEANKNKRKKYRNATKEKARNLIQDAKNRPCAHCGQQLESFLMEFAHRHGTKKVSRISGMYKSYGIEAIKKEIAKCDVLCVVCHRRYDTHIFTPN